MRTWCRWTRTTTCSWPPATPPKSPTPSSTCPRGSRPRSSTRGSTWSARACSPASGEARSPGGSPSSPRCRSRPPMSGGAWPPPSARSPPSLLNQGRDPPGLDRYLHQRTGGMIGSLSHLIRGAAIEAIQSGSEQITRKLLDTIGIDHAAQQGNQFRDGCRPPHRGPPVTAEAAQPPPGPLPIRPRPVSGETTFSYLRPVSPSPTTCARCTCAATSRTPAPGAGPFAPAGLPSWPDGPSCPCSTRSPTRNLPSAPPRAAARPTHASANGRRQNCSRSSAAMPASAACQHRHSPTSTEPASESSARRSGRPTRPRANRSRSADSRIDPFTAVIDDMLQAELQAFPAKRQPVISIYRELVTRHGTTKRPRHLVRKCLGRRRAVMQHQSLSPAHQAVADHDLNRLAQPARNGHDIEDDNGDGWSLLRRVVHAQADRHTRTGEPLHADITAFPARPRRQATR